MSTKIYVFQQIFIDQKTTFSVSVLNENITLQFYNTNELKTCNLILLVYITETTKSFVQT